MVRIDWSIPIGITVLEKWPTQINERDVCYELAATTIFKISISSDDLVSTIGLGFGTIVERQTEHLLVRFVSLLILCIASILFHNNMTSGAQVV